MDEVRDNLDPGCACGDSGVRVVVLSNDQKEPSRRHRRLKQRHPGTISRPLLAAPAFAGHGNGMRRSLAVLYARGDKVQLQDNGGTISASVYQISDQAIPASFPGRGI